jgi:drug/metabolite transporter (DMT)-like permease
MLWLIVTLSAYFILAFVFLIDKYLLISGIPNPKVYAFFIGIAGIFLLAIVPFIDFVIPSANQIILSFSAGASYVYALYWFFKGLKNFDASRIVPATGGLVPLFSFALVYIFSLGKETLSFLGILSFIFLIIGSVLITLEKGKFFSKESFKISLIASFFFALSFVFTKYVYLSQPFLSGLVWTRMGGVLMASIFFIFSPDIKKEIFKRKEGLQKKTPAVFIANQLAGASAGLLQNWGIALAPLACVAIINALQGTQYVFLLVLAVFLSLKFPQILKENITKSAILQKILAILFICTGLLFLTLR